ncbi:MAG: quinone oxidoreductase [Flavobacteriaceae bacterium]
MIRAVRVHKTGGPEVLTLEDVEIGEPGAGEIRIRHAAIGLNFIDIYFRTGLYAAPQFPFTPGNEGAGIVSAVGSGVDHLKVGDRVAYAATLGSYAQERIIAADRAVILPESISDTVAASVMLKGMTARFLLRRTFKVEPGHTILFHAAAGGVGQIAVQWAKHLGATVIGTAGGAEKCALAKSLGCDHVIDYRAESFVDRVREITGGKGVSVVYDSVGKDTFPGSLDCLEPRGLWVSFGNASGAVENFSIGILSQKGSLYATRPILFHHIAKRADLEASANDLFAVLAGKHVKVPEPRTYALAEVADAHRDMEGRRTTGASVLIP